MVRKLNIKTILLLCIMIVISKSVFAYQILVDAFIQENPNEVEYILSMSAYKKTRSFYNGNTETYTNPTNQYYSSLADIKKAPHNFNYTGNTGSVKVKKTNGYVYRDENPQHYNTLPDYYSIGRAVSVFHKNVGTNYNGNHIKIGYESYQIGKTLPNGEPNVFSLKNEKATISAGPSDIGIVGYLNNTEYRFKIVNGVYYGYHKIPTETLKPHLTTIQTRFDTEPQPGRLYMSAAMRTKNDAYPFKPGHTSFTVNLTTAYQALALPKMSGEWQDTAVSGIKKNIKGQDTNIYQYNKSIVNMYDNVFQLGEKKKIKRIIYVQHISTDGKILAEFKNTSAKMITPPGTRATGSTQDYPQFHERYDIESPEAIEIRKSDKDGSYVGEKTYTFTYGTAAKGKTMAQALVAPANFSWTSSTSTFRTDVQDDFVVIKLYYEPGKVTENLNLLSLQGRLCFINERDSSYRNATTGDILDYTPSSGTNTIGRLTPYIKDAYPYVVRGLNYDQQSSTHTANANIRVSIGYYYTKWTYHHVGRESEGCPKLICRISEHTHSSSCYRSPGKDADGNPLPEVRVCGRSEHTHGYSCYSYHDGCGWRKTTPYDSKSKTLDYSVPYTYIRYNINNLKIYRIKDVDVYDNERNEGGTLFSGGTYKINVSSNYNRRFTSSSGLNRAQVNVNFPSSSYTLPTISNTSMPMPSGGTSTPHGTVRSNESTTESEAQNKMDAQTHKVAAETRNLTISYNYCNDFVELDSLNTMVDRNYKSWSEPIRDASVTTRVLDATKRDSRTAGGVDNGQPISYTANLNNFMKPSIKLTTKSDFEDNYQTVPETRENGIRILSGKIYYEIERSSKYNIGSDSFAATDYTYTINSKFPPDVYGSITPADLVIQDKSYSGDEVNKINVFTPISLGGINLSSSERVDHTAGGVSNSLTIQKNAYFMINVNPSSYNEGSYRFSDTREFIKGYYFMCNFDVEFLEPDGSLRYVPQFQTMYVDGAYATFKARPVSSAGDSAIDFSSNSVKVVAVSKNRTEKLKQYYEGMLYITTQYVDDLRNQFTTANTQRQKDLLTRSDIISDGYHAASKIITSVNLGRIFDFAVTDCTDIAFKDVFRKTTDGNVNEPTGNIYYSGVKRWYFEDSEYNTLIDRTDLGTNQKKTLPLGPYKHINDNIIASPKMGYRISFDLKTTGYMLDDNKSGSRSVRITPSYYYISKDGTTYKNRIRLFYKNPNGQYVPFVGSGYKIYFRPNDGYRYLRNSEYFNNFDLMSKNLEGVDVSNTLILTNKMMATNNDSFLQGWYGEYKLPNSTIAVEVDASGRYDINKHLTNGYIGVIFDIRSIDVGGRTLLYNTRDKSGASTNTSQWDYEGFLKMTSPGSSFSGSLKLEKGTWYINNATYQDIKGTVVLFDLDNRAADDFQ